MFVLCLCRTTPETDIPDGAEGQWPTMQVSGAPEKLAMTSSQDDGRQGGCDHQT